MPLTDQQKKFVSTYVANAAALSKLREERYAELETLKPAKVNTSALEGMLKRTGRADDPDGKKKAAFLQDVLLKDEDGMNAALLAEKISPVTPQEREAARNGDAAALEKMAQLRGAQDYIAREIESQVLAALPVNYATMSPAEQAAAIRTAKNTALESLSTTHSVGLSHHASRHGPQTTMDENVTRVATAYPPDKPDRTAIGKTTHTTRTGETVQVPNSLSKGSEPTNAASWMTSAEMGLFILEDALTKAHEAASLQGLASGERIAVDRVGNATDRPIGDSAEVSKGSVGGNPTLVPIKVDGTQLPSVNQLNNGLPAAKAQVIADRVASIRIVRDIKSSKVVLEETSDGGFRTVTAFPDARVATGAQTKRIAGVDTQIDYADLARKKEEKRLKDAEDAAKAARDEAVKAKAAADLAFAGIGPSVKALITELALSPAAKPEMDTLQVAARAHRRAEMTIEALTAARIVPDKTVADLTLGLAPPNDEATLKADLDNAKLAFDAANSPANAQAFRVAADKHAQAVKAGAALARAKANVAKIEADLLIATKAVADAKKVLDDAMVDAVAASSAQAAQKAVTAAIAAENAVGDHARLKKEQERLEKEAALAEELLVDLKERQASAAEPDESDLTSIQMQMLMAKRAQDIEDEKELRRTALLDAAKLGPAQLQDAKKALASEIDNAEKLLQADKAMRDADRDRIIKKREAALAKREDAAKKLAIAEAGLGALSPDAKVAAAKEITRLQEEMEEAAKLHVQMRQEANAAKMQDQMEDKMAAAGIALARAELEAMSAKAELDALPPGSPEAARQALVFLVREAEQLVQTHEAAHPVLVAEARDARRNAAVLAREITRVDDLLKKPVEDLALAQQAALGGAPLPPDAVALRDKVIPQLQGTRAKYVQRQTAAAAKALAAEQAVNANQKDLEAARKALATARANLPKP